jgi:hypothetical protein
MLNLASSSQLPLKRHSSPFPPPQKSFLQDLFITTPYPPPIADLVSNMARGNRTSLLMGLSALCYLVLLFSPLAYIPTASAETDAQDPLQDNYGVGKYNSSANSNLHNLLTFFSPRSHRNRSRNHIFLRRCDAEGQSRNFNK